MSEVDIKILGLSATPVKDGNCDTFVKEGLKGARELEGEGGKVMTEFVSLAVKKIAMCQNCLWCIENKAPCKVKDDAQ